MRINDLVGKKCKYYGSKRGNTFRLDDYVFEAVEDESDGYRSYLDKILTLPEIPYEYQNLLPIATVIIIDEDFLYLKENIRTLDSGYQLVDADTAQLLLEVGTDNEDDYYPAFVFNTYDKKKVN
jgi:hypothetical protein